MTYKNIFRKIDVDSKSKITLHYKKEIHFPIKGYVNIYTAKSNAKTC